MTETTTVLVNAHVLTMVPSGGDADALAWRGEQLLAVGRRDDVVHAAGRDATTWDAGGATVLPGFIDAHHHPCIVALYGGRTPLTPPDVTDIASLQRAIARAAATVAPGEWIVATGWDEMHLAERRAPTVEELTDAAPDHPLLAMHYSCHRAATNRRGLTAAGIDRHTSDPSGGAISRGRRGEPDGLLIERGMSGVESLARASLIARDGEQVLRALAAHHDKLLAAGITRVVDATVPGDLATLYREAAGRGLLRVPTVMMPVSVTGYLEAPTDALDGPPTGTREGMLEVGPLKLVLDGAPGCAMCLGWWQAAGAFVSSVSMGLRSGSLASMRTMMSAAPRIGAKLRTGIRIYAREEARSVVAQAVARGFGVATHAIGNEAIDVALAAFESVGADVGRAGRPRLEHASFLDRDLVRRIADVGAAVVTQPGFLTMPGIREAPSIPGLRNMPLRWLLDAGVTVAGSSDHPVAGLDPLDGVRAAVTRDTGSGRAYEPDQRIELTEALTMYTRAAAQVSGCGDRCGTLEPGKRADVVVLDRALTSPARLEGARVRATVVGGAVRSGSLGSSRARA